MNMQKDTKQFHINVKREQSSTEQEQRIPSRVELHGHKYKKKRKAKNAVKKKRRKVSIPFILLVILLLLPLSIYSLVTMGEKSKANPSSSSGEKISYEQSNSYESQIDDSEDDQKKESKEEPPEEVNNQENKKAGEEPQNAPDIAEDQKKEKIEKEQKIEEEQKDTDNGQTSEGEERYHIVQPGETLYRISMNYYQSNIGIEKIRSANGIIGNEISAGQKLIIPK